MRIHAFAKLFLAAVPLLTGCTGFWNAPSSSSGGGGGSGSKATSGIFFVANQTPRNMASYSFQSGTYTAANNSPYPLQAQPYCMAIAPGGGYMYVGTIAGIFVYKINTGGTLTLENNSLAISSDLATAMHVDSTGAWLIEAGPGLAELIAIPISPTTGLPTSTTEQVIALPSADVHQIAISPDNTQVFVALGSGGTEVASFTAANTSPFGITGNIKLTSAAGSALSVAVDPSNRLLYIGETAATSGSNSGGLRAFNYKTLAEVSGSPYPSGGLAPSAILPLPHGTSPGAYVYVANSTVSGSSNGNIAGFSFTATGTVYTLTALSATATAGTTPTGLAEDSTGTYLLAINSGGSPDLDAYTFDSTTAGKLDLAFSEATGTDPVQAIAIAAMP